MYMGYIYQIVNTKTNSVYIGSTIRKNPQKRWWRHTQDLRKNLHHNKFLQRSWNKHGETSFKFEILENVNDLIILLKEQEYLDKRKQNYPPKQNYNNCWIAGNCVGRKFSQETIQKLKNSHLGIHPSKESIEKQIKSWENKCKHSYSFTSPDGKIFNDIKNLRKFSREQNSSV